MPEPIKPSLSETAVARKIDVAVQEVLAEVKKAEDLREIASRKSLAAKAVTASFDISERYPLGSWALGTVFVVGSLWLLDGIKLYIGCAVGVTFVPGLARKIVSLVMGLAKAKKGA